MTGESPEGLNEAALTLRVLALERWRDVESRLRARGCTLGWAPPASSLETMGELLEARARGLRSTLYGDAAASCVAVEAVLANGDPVRSRVVPRSAAGPDWKHLLLGGRGKPGRISAAVLRVHPVPALMVPQAFELREAGAAVDALASTLHHGAIPAVAAVDPADRGFRVYLTFEGHAGLSRARATIAARIFAAAGATGLGGDVATRWLSSVEQGGELRSGLFLRPALQMEGRWGDLGGMVRSIRDVAGIRYAISHLRHDGATLLVEAPSLAVDALGNLATRIEHAGGVRTAGDPASGPVASRLLAPLSRRSSASS